MSENKSANNASLKEQFKKDFKKLKVEFGGIKKVIEIHTSDGDIKNYVDQLEIAISSYDIEGIKYCLSGISKWYNRTIIYIRNTPYVRNKMGHEENKIKIENFITAFEKYDESVVSPIDTASHHSSNATGEPIIFLSHNSVDKKYADAIEEFIMGLGVKKHQLIYTSHPKHKIPLDANIYDYLRKNINNKVFMIILWSDAYLNSPACLNEMGAAWVTQSDYTNIYVPTFSFGNPKYHECAVDTKKMGAVLKADDYCKASMMEFKNKIQKLFNLENDEEDVMFLLDKFMKKIAEVQENG